MLSKGLINDFFKMSSCIFYIKRETSKKRAIFLENGSAPNGTKLTLKNSYLKISIKSSCLKILQNSIMLSIILFTSLGFAISKTINIVWNVPYRLDNYQSKWLCFYNFKYKRNYHAYTDYAKTLELRILDLNGNNLYEGTVSYAYGSKKVSRWINILLKALFKDFPQENMYSKKVEVEYDYETGFGSK